MQVISDLQGAIDHLKSHIDLADVMGEVVKLEKAGSDLLKALCCFHEENTPSLTVTPSKGLYHCFGCKASGDIITFYKDYHHMSTVEAIYALSDKYDISITQFEREPTEEEVRNTRLEAINRAVRDGLHEILLADNNRGKLYLQNRGITEDTMIEFGLGYSPSHREVFSLAQGDQQDLEVLGLASSNERQWRDAIVYTLHDARGRVIGFKNRPYHDGREVDEQGRKLPKFIGTSSKSPLHSDHDLYGFHIARKHLVDGRLIVVEGQHDVLIAHQHGIKNVAGTDSTALNEPKLKLLEEFGVREIVVVYDGDNAGREASYKIASEASESGTNISIKIASMPDGMDPDELIQSQGKTQFLQIVHEAVYASQYIIDQIANQIPLTTVTNKMDFIKRCEPIMTKAQTFEREFIIRYVAEKVDIDHTVIEDMLRAEESKLLKSLLYNIEGEKIVLGGILRDSEFRLEAMDFLNEDDWYLHKHKLLFEIIVEMDRNAMPITIDTIKTTINNKAMKQTFNEGAFVDEVYASMGSYESLLEDIKDKSLRRKLIKEAEELKRKAQDTRSSTIFVSEEHLNKIEKITTGASNMNDISTPHSGAKNFMDTLHDRMQNPGKIVGHDMGPSFQILTGLLNGLQNKKLITIAANQSVGKTTLTANLLNHIAITNKIPWAHFSLEMPEEEMVQKFIGIRSGVNTQRIERGNVTDDEYSRIRRAAIDYHEGGLYIIDNCITLESIVNKTRSLMRNHGVQGISIDYLQLMSLEKSFGKKKYEEEGEISGALKNDVAKRFDIPVIAVSQMSRRALDRDIQKAEDGQGAYKIAQDSDIYMILQDKSQEEIDEWGIEYGNQILNLDKNRGGTADVLIDIYFDKDTQRMSEVTQKGATH